MGKIVDIQVGAVDIEELRNQKAAVIGSNIPTEEKWGLVNLLDAIQDYVIDTLGEDEGYVLFGFRPVTEIAEEDRDNV